MTTFKPVKIGIIGCGMISEIYLKNCCRRYNILDVVGCADIKPERSERRAKEFGIRQMTNEEIFADPEIEIVINITYQTSHYAVTKAALLAGKHVYSEKMLAVTYEQAKELTEIAKEKGLYLCCAPDTFLGAGAQTARKALDDGWIGTPVAAEAILVRSYHHERYRDDPERRFAFCPGGGIIYDMGCYYLTGLVNLLGPIRRVCGFGQTREPDSRLYRNPANPDYGKVMAIETPNNVGGTLEFACGVICPFLTTSEGANFTNRFTIYGTEGTLTLNDPNEYTGPVAIRAKTGDNMVLPQPFGFTDNSRGLGCADLAYAIRNGRKPRTGWECGLHTLEAAEYMIRSGEEGMIHTMETTCERAEPFAQGCTEYAEMVLDI